MPYSYLGSQIDVATQTEGWQLHVAVDPSALIQGGENNKIEIVFTILQQIARKYRVDPYLFLFQDEQEIIDGCEDGTVSHAGQHPHRGKEIILCLPNQNTAFSNLTYERLVLELWSLLQKAGVPLHSNFLPGTNPILVSDNLPTPFSVSRNSQSRPEKRHGDVFKEADRSLPAYPLTTLKLTQSALAIYGITVNKRDGQYERESFARHQHRVKQRLASDFNAVRKSLPRQKTLKQVLDSQRLTAHFDQYQQDKRAKLAKEPELLALYPEIERLLNHYPHAADSDFSDHDALLALKSGTSNTMKIAQCIEELRADYDAKLDAIKADFRRHVQGNNKSPRTMTIDWPFYLPDCSLNEIDQLIEQSPAAMQRLYRRVVWLERERLAHEEFKKQWLRLNYSSACVYQPLSQLAAAIQGMQTRAWVNSDVLQRFGALYQKIEEELFAHSPCPITETAFPLVLNHFTDMARRLQSGSLLSCEEVSQFAQDLEQDLAAMPVSRGLRVCMAGCLGALLGLIIGFLIGAALTGWGGGFGALPGAIAGMTLAPGLIMGGSAVIVGTALGTAAATVGLFSARGEKPGITEQKQRNKESLLAQMNDVIEVLYHQDRPYEDEETAHSRVVAFD